MYDQVISRWSSEQELCSPWGHLFKKACCFQQLAYKYGDIFSRNNLSSKVSKQSNMQKYTNKNSRLNFNARGFLGTVVKRLSPLSSWVGFLLRTRVKRVSQRSAESRGFSPGAPVSSHSES
jgi:hypothetical protein